MQKFFLTVAVVLLALSFSTEAFAQVYVEGYFRSNGTYVAPHWRSSPDNSYNNNWSVSPNVNPYTGNRGTLSPTWNDRPPTNLYGTQNLYQPNTLWGGQQQQKLYSPW